MRVSAELLAPGPADAGLTGKMDDGVDPKRAQSLGVQIGDILFDEPEAIVHQAGEVGLFERRIVIRGQRVDTDDDVATFQQRTDEVGSDEPGSAGDEDPNRSALPMCVSAGSL